MPATRPSPAYESISAGRPEPTPAENHRPTAQSQAVMAIEAKVTGPNGQRHGVASKEPKLVPSMAPRSWTLGANKLAKAAGFLRYELREEVQATVVEAHARKAGIAVKTLKRARAKLGIVSRREALAHAASSICPCQRIHSGPTGA
jgi:hypothetical protein